MQFFFSYEIEIVNCLSVVLCCSCIITFDDKRFLLVVSFDRDCCWLSVERDYIMNIKFTNLCQLKIIIY